MNRVVGACLLGVLAMGAPSAAAQQPGKAFAGGTLVATLFDSEVASNAERFTGVLLGLEGRVPVWRLELDIRYLNGGVSPDRGTIDIDVVEAELLLGFRPIRWVTVKTGPHARSFKTGDVVERWFFWEVRARAEVGLLAPNLVTYLELWGALTGDANFGQSFGSGRGAEAGMRYQLPNLPLWGRLAYRVDRGSVDLAQGSRFDSIQQVFLGVGWTK